MVTGCDTRETQVGKASRREFGNESSKCRKCFWPVIDNCPIQRRVTLDIGCLQEVGELCSWESSSASIDNWATEEGLKSGAETISRMRDSIAGTVRTTGTAGTAVRFCLIRRKENTDCCRHWTKSAGNADVETMSEYEGGVLVMELLSKMSDLLAIIEGQVG